MLSSLRSVRKLGSERSEGSNCLENRWLLLANPSDFTPFSITKQPSNGELRINILCLHRTQVKKYFHLGLA